MSYLQFTVRSPLSLYVSKDSKGSEAECLLFGVTAIHSPRTSQFGRQTHILAKAEEYIHEVHETGFVESSAGSVYFSAALKAACASDTVARKQGKQEVYE